MNDTTDTDNNTPSGLTDSFGDRGINVNAMGFGHPYAEQILKQAREILAESQTGSQLLQIESVHKVPVFVMKGMGASGYNPQSNIIYLQVSGKVDKASPDLVLELTKGLREADQQLVGYVAPDPTKDIVEYAAVMHAKALDSIMYICKVVKELTNSSYYSVLLDSLTKLGHINLYKAYENDASEQELYDIYAGK